MKSTLSFECDGEESLFKSETWNSYLEFLKQGEKNPKGKLKLLKCYTSGGGMCVL